MLKADRIAVWCLIVILAFVYPAKLYIQFIDELMAFCMLGLGVLDAMLNNNWKRYRLLWMVVGIMLFYLVYTLAFKHYNTPTAVIADAIIQGKPFYPFAVMLALRPRLTGVERKILIGVAIFNITLGAIFMAMPIHLAETVIGHISVANITITINTAVLLYCLTYNGRTISLHRLILVFLAFSIGLFSFKAKFFGEYVIYFFLFFIYRPGMFRRIGFKQMLILGSVAAMTILVSWQKITYYFLNAGLDILMLENEDSYARPVLYVVGSMIMMDQVPFGSGLASFASFKSSSPYSGLYAEYGIDQVWGLSEAKPDFINDAFYPSLAQFGVVGVMLFISLWVYIYRIMLRFLRRAEPLKWPFVCGMMLMVFCLIESIAGSTFVSSSGLGAMAMLGMICGQAKALPDQSPATITNQD